MPVWTRLEGRGQLFGAFEFYLFATNYPQAKLEKEILQLRARQARLEQQMQQFRWSVVDSTYGGGIKTDLTLGSTGSDLSHL